MEFSHRLELFGPEIFAALNDKKVALEAEGRHLYNLSVGTPDFAPADHLKQALIDAAQDNENWKYSLRDIPEMLNAVCGYYQRRFNVDTITPDKVMSFSGSQDGIGHLGLALCNDGDLVLLPDPCYPVFMTGSRLGGAEPWYYKLTKENHFLPDVSAIPEDVARKAKFMLVSLPANPWAASARRSSTPRSLLSAVSTTFCSCMTTHTAISSLTVPTAAASSTRRGPRNAQWSSSP